MAIKNYWRFNNDVLDSAGANNGSFTGVDYTYEGGLNNSLCFGALKNTYISFGLINNFTTESFTISLFVFVKSFTTSTAPNPTPILIQKGLYQSDGYYATIGTTAISFYTNQAGAIQTSSTSDTYSTNKWYRIVFTRSGANVKIYVDGLNKTTTLGVHVDPKTAPTRQMIINAYVGAVIIGNIKVDEYIIEERVWLDSEIKNKYSYYKGFF